MYCPRALAVALVAMTCALGTGPEKPGMPPAKVEVTAQNKDQIITDIVKSAREKWIAHDLNPELADKLAKDLTVVMRSYLTDDFDSIHRLWTERGASLAKWAAAGAEQEFDSGRYDAADVERLKAASPEEQVKYLWAHPAERGAKWEKIGTDHLLAGTELSVMMGGRDWPVNGGAGMGSRWQSPADQKAEAAWLEGKKAPPPEQGWAHLESRDADAPKPASADGWVSLQNKAMDGGIPAAFVQFPVKMLKGGTILWRMSFAYDKERAAWYPIELSYSISERGEAHPLF